MSNQYSDEIDLKQLRRQVGTIVKARKKLFISILCIFVLLATVFFIKTIYSPSYKATCILVSKNIKKDQINENIEYYNNFIKNPGLSISNSKLLKSLELINLSSLKIDELKNTEALPVKENEYNYVQYKLTAIYNSNSSYPIISIFFDTLISDIQQINSKDNRVVEMKIRYESGLKDIDSIINIANKAANNYTSKISSNSNSQLMVMNDIYNGINNLVTQKLNLTQELSMLQPHNLIFKSTPIIITKKLEYPWTIFIIAILIWIIVCIVMTLFELIFGEKIN